jgi:hypothetical protein
VESESSGSEFPPRPDRFYHRTDADSAVAILRDEFRDGRPYSLTWAESFSGIEHSGVWLSDVPISVFEGLYGDVVLVIDAPAATIETFEWRDEHQKSYREFCVPARVLNACAMITHVIENFMSSEQAVSVLADWPEDVRKSLGPLAQSFILGKDQAR